MQFITISTLYPSSEDPKNGIFVETRLRKYLEAYPDSKVKVIAPVPWFPLKGGRWGEYGRFARVPKYEKWNDIEIYHPRYIVLPKIGMLITPFFLALSIWLCLKKVRSQFKPDFIDGHYFYPDGVSISWTARMLKLPYFVTARGTDLNLIPEYSIPRKLILRAAKNSLHSITVCEALRQTLINLGESEHRVSTLRNGVDLELFRVLPSREKLRAELGIKGKTIISVGHLIERKGHYLIIEAISRVPDVTLLIAGEGPDLAKLQQLAEKFNVSERVVFLGGLRQVELARYYNAADALVLASSREGWANVLLESMACGTPVVATNIWGTPEIVKEREAGVLVNRNVADLAEAIQSLLDELPSRPATRSYAEKFSWDETIQGMQRLFKMAYGDKA